MVPNGGGVITSWSVHGFGAPAQIGLKTVREELAGNYVIRGTSAEETVAPSGTSTFATRIVAAAGDELALWVPAEFPGKAPCNYVSGNPDDVFAYKGGSYAEPAVGDDYGPTDQSSQNMRLNVSAQLEPDDDRDGYGDGTQDGCLDDPFAHVGPCLDRVPPKTRITEMPRPTVKTRKRKAKVKFEFTADEPATFSCTLDAKTKPCSSPFKARVKKGSHVFSVVATDRAGNVDETPVQATFEVKRKR